MTTGNGSKKGAKANQPRATDLRFERARVVVTLADAREVSVPLAWYPTLKKASPSQRGRWTMLGSGLGFHWPALDLDLSVAGIVHGLPELIPRPPRIPATARASRR
jgi:hypothetical protein